MEKVLRAGEQAPTKPRILRPLYEFLEEQQEPFLLEEYLLDRLYSCKRIHACPNGDLSSEGLSLLDFKSRAPRLLIGDSCERNGSEHSPGPYPCGLLEMNQRKKKKKRRRVSQDKIRSDNLDFLGYSEEYHMEELHVNVKRLKITVQQSKTTEMMQLESKRGHGMEHAGASIAKTEASLMPFMKFFSFKKVKKMDKVEKRKEPGAEKTVKCFLLKSIIKKMTPTKNFLPAIDTDVNCVSKKFSNAKKKLRCGISEDELCKDNQVQHQVSDIVSWDSFNEVPPSLGDQSSNVGANCVSSEPVQEFPDLMDVDLFSAEDPRHPLQLSEIISQELEVERSNQMVQLQPVIRGSSSGSVGFSSTSSSSCSSCFDSDMGSTPLDKLSSENSFKELTRANFNPSEGIRHSLIEATCSAGYLSLDNDEYHAKDSQPLVFKEHDKMNHFHEKNCSSVETLQQEYIHSSTPIPKSSRIFDISGQGENPKKFSGSARNVDLVLGEANKNSQEDEGHRNASSAYDLREKNRDVYCQEKNLQYAFANGCSVESKLQSPVSVLEMSSDEEPSELEQTDACSPITEHRFVQRYSEGSQHSFKKSSISEHRAYGEVPYEGGNGSFSDLSLDNIHGSKVHNVSHISSYASSFQCQEEMDWEHAETEEYVKKVLSSPDTMSCLMSLDDSEIQDLTCFSSPDHDGFLPPQCLKRKEIPKCTKKLLFDCVKEILESVKKQYCSGVLKKPWLKECFVSEHLAKVICSQINSWMERDTNITERMVELTWKKEGKDWTLFQVEAEEIGIEIEAYLFGLLIEELVDDLSRLHP